ncbi:MAG: fructosamine kinase family protein [Bdellovibrionales bacterium]|nr:fructosamine kinase family protein [Bdellovibrionales bacterium]NQZ17875.1 fructosamine kinase family protein [Bdellovibrionales bacterium]
MLEDQLKSSIEKQLDRSITAIEPLSGGCSYPSYVITSHKERFFLKHSETPTDVFIKEANGLTEITEALYDFCPDVITANNNFLLLDYITPERPTHIFWQSLATKLAKLHKVKKESYGFFEDNFIGPAPQKNKVSEDKLSWGEFFWNYRIIFQLELNKERHGLMLAQDEKDKLKEAIIQKLNSYNAYPTVLHGDLWNGNIHCAENQKAFLIDPASYYGDREADIAMTECFGGFSEQFYDVYNEILPLDKGYQERKHIYNLYHMLNHYYLFGSSYKQTCDNIIQLILQNPA